MIALLILGGIIMIDVTMTNLSYGTIVDIYASVAKKWAIAYNVDYKYVLAIIKKESGGNPFAVGKTKDYGLMQITSGALQDFNKQNMFKYNMFDLMFFPNHNIQVGTWYLSWLVKQFNGDYSLAVSAYNQGIGNVKDGHYTLDYYAAVMEHYNNIKQITNGVKA